MASRTETVATIPATNGSSIRTPSPDTIQHSSPRFPSQQTSRTTSFRDHSSSAVQLPGGGPQRYFRSRRINADEIQKPWLEKKDPRRKWHTIIPVLGISLGVVFVALLCWQGYSSVINYDYCLLYTDDFSSGVLDETVWTKEVEVGGFG